MSEKLRVSVRLCLRVLALTLFATLVMNAADHGPVFGLATPTNPEKGWSFNLGASGRNGSGGVSAALQAELSYGITGNLKLAASAPLWSRGRCSACAFSGGDPYPRSSITLNTPISRDFSGLAWWRFHRKDLAGKRIESTAIAGILIPGPQTEPGPFRNLNSGPGYLVGGVTGLASRSQYVWFGASYQRYAESKGDRRPDLFSYSAVYGYRPYSWRTDYPRWDWRLFAEFTGERGGSIYRLGAEVPDSRFQQLSLGPSVLGVYRAIGIGAGMQFPLYRNVGSVYPTERYRFAINFAYFF